MTAAPLDLHEWLSFEDPDEARTWTFDVTFLLSRWTCIFGRGCRGVLPEDATHLVQGCCSHGAHFTDEADRDRVEAFVATLAADEWQHRTVGRRRGTTFLEPGGSWQTRLHDGACILLNRPGFPAGAGCALHVAAERRGLHHAETKPEVCWQLPLRRVDSTDELGHVTSTLREWKRRDWGEGGEDFAWWCTESDEAFGGEGTVLATMRREIELMCGAHVYELLLEALSRRCATTTVLPHPAVRTRRSPGARQPPAAGSSSSPSGPAGSRRASSGT
ncbi:MAG: hypothetical protein M3503_00295 [Actinomycetota bacterium]|nr:hypothetical protein [Actinomycetota bacterium]